MIEARLKELEHSIKDALAKYDAAKRMEEEESDTAKPHHHWIYIHHLRLPMMKICHLVLGMILLLEE